MTLDEIRQVLELVREHELAEFELQQEGVTLRLRKGQVPVFAAPASVVASTLAPSVAAAVSPADPAPLPASSVAAPTAEALSVITAPIVGTFYRAPSPDAPPFADVGTRVKKGQTICIIEAMKLMNEIEAEYDGDVVSVYVENGQPVQYGDRLFAIRRG